MYMICVYMYAYMLNIADYYYCTTDIRIRMCLMYTLDVSVTVCVRIHTLYCLLLLHIFTYISVYCIQQSYRWLGWCTCVQCSGVVQSD